MAEDTVHGSWWFYPEERDVPRSNGLEVIGAGFPRTGTLSLHFALNVLGYETYHMSKVDTPAKADLWSSFYDGEVTIEQVAKQVYEENGFTAAVDAPTSTVWDKLAQLYPKAKIILTERNSPQYLQYQSHPAVFDQIRSLCVFSVWAILWPFGPKTLAGGFEFDTQRPMGDIGGP
eukprot:CAMPEP_0168852640 /NCGR_PEP_ID=MMETSP0727-20121128/13086_1 /TAXON_ID=265536 /ORGANISM="Amphiprora sp., Strain CCMP467" /LENGTH=174 /DNA_ID=CAMNT_0008906779 /DNA_START=136 /DNA_END=657 /DNA_ORIENTATION=-